MPEPKDDKLLTLFLQELRNRLGDHLKQVILFGSRARGDSNADSDYDCLAVLDEISPTVKKLVDEIAGEFLFEYNAVFSILPVSEERFRQQRYNPLFMNIRNEGVVL